ncbi:MAG TPA: hypothetical protein VF508_05765 [Pyrinomonadaceae bacterium]|jgi:hypothetical protein
MKSYRNATAALALTLVLASSAFAGVMHTDGAPAPPSTSTANGEMQTGATEGEIHTGDAASTSEAADAVTVAALNLLQSVLTLL